jgi:hypothetical protein
MSSQLTPPTDTDRHTHNTAPTRFAEVDAVRFAYRRFGNPTGTPIVLLQRRRNGGGCRLADRRARPRAR